MTANSDENPNPEIDKLIHEPARLRIMTQLYVVERADYVFLMGQLDLTWGNLSSHLSKLEAAGYVEIDKGYEGKKPRTVLCLTEKGREAFQDYRMVMKRIINGLPK
ncbi:MAG: winged helix-turn-helix domain-containing protein [Candidatus Thorarchaeota archaeon]|jgi:DNA-binding MarR family transcriptional regulator